MQSYPLILSPATPAKSIPAAADLFVYESGVVTPDTGDARIIVKADSGSEITLRPGQRFRLVGQQTNWAIRAYDPSVSIVAQVIIGSGEFDDANTLNTFKLDGGFANSVTVTNTTGQRVPVAIDPNAVLNTGLIVAYTDSFSTVYTNSTNTGGGVVQMLAAARNVNGAVMNRFEIESTTAGISGFATVLAKATAPISEFDGVVLFRKILVSGAAVRVSQDVSRDGMVKVPPGLGIWYVFGNGALAGVDGAYKSALFTVL